MISQFVVPAAVFRELPAGGCGPASTAFLRSTQLSKHLQLIAAIVQAAAEHRDLTDAVRVLTPGAAAVASVAVVEELLSDPCVGAWAAHCTNRMAADPSTAIPLAVELAYLNNVAAAAAIRCGLDADLDLRTHDGEVFLPGLGAAAVAPPGDTVVRCVVDGGRARLRLPDGDREIQTDGASPQWRPLRQLSAVSEDRRLTVTLNDLDPYRGCHGKPVAERLTEAEVGRWRERLGGAWDLLVRYAPERAAELSGLRALVPLAEEQVEVGLSATSRGATGMLGLTLPARPAHLAITLVHEYQHSLLGCLQDLVDLHDLDPARTLFAPWRRDPRHLSGVLQGVHAFLAVCDVWNRFRADEAVAAEAERHFAELRVQVEVALRALEASARLTPDGTAFVARMAAAMARLLEVDLPEPVTTAAQAELDRLRSQWVSAHGPAAV